MQRTNQDWIADLSSSGQTREDALADLRSYLADYLPFGLSKYLSPSSPHFEHLLEETIQETLLRVLDRLETFKGNSQFTTWVMKIAVRIALTELRRKRWQNVSLEDLVMEDNDQPLEFQFPDGAATPNDLAERSDLIRWLRSIIMEELTDYQRQALTIVGMQGIPMDQAAGLLKTNRNALYKLLHDARIRLKNRMAREGLSPQEFLDSFEKKR